MGLEKYRDSAVVFMGVFRGHGKQDLQFQNTHKSTQELGKRAGHFKLEALHQTGQRRNLKQAPWLGWLVNLEEIALCPTRESG